MEPIYEFDNKDIKEHSDSISHDCRLIEAQSISFLLYLDSQIDAEQDLVKKEKLKNALASLSSRVDETTKLKSELLDSYKEIDVQYTNLKKMGFGDIIENYYATFGVSNNAKVNEEEMVNDAVKEAVPEVVNEVTNEIPVVEEKVEEVPEMVADVPVAVPEAVEENVVTEEPVVQETAEVVEENVATEEPVAEETPEVVEENAITEEPVAQETAEAVEETTTEAPIVADEVVTEEVPAEVAPEETTDESTEAPIVENEEPSLVPIVDNAQTEEVNEENTEEPVLTPTVTEEAPEEPTLVPIVDNATPEATEEVAPEVAEEAAPEAASEEGVVPEEVATDVGDAVVQEETASEEIVVPEIVEGAANTEEAPTEEAVVEEAVAPEEPAENMELPKPVEFIPAAAAEKQEEAVADVPIPIVEEENVKPEEDNTQEAVQVAENTEGLTKFKKEDNNPVSRILVTESQYNALKQSLSKQEALLSAREKTQAVQVNDGAVPTEEVAEEDPQAKIEAMMEKANQLYQAGDTDGAQALYDQISIENEKLKEMQAVK